LPLIRGFRLESNRNTKNVHRQVACGTGPLCQRANVSTRHRLVGHATRNDDSRDGGPAGSIPSDDIQLESILLPSRRRSRFGGRSAVRATKPLDQGNGKLREPLSSSIAPSMWPLRRALDLGHVTGAVECEVRAKGFARVNQKPPREARISVGGLPLCAPSASE
jgi:hypothetical protein